MTDGASLPYLLDEQAISAQLGYPIPTLRVFNLETFGVDRKSFLRDMKPMFSVLHLDPYDAKRAKVELLKKRFPAEAERLNDFLADYYAGQRDLAAVFDLIAKLSAPERNEFDRIGMTGRRKRSVARFMLGRVRGRWVMERLPAKRYQQKVGSEDPRALVRIFNGMEAMVSDHPQIRQLMQCLADEVCALRPGTRVLELTVHQMFVFADIMSTGDNSPEGIHQDGADYVVSALVIERAGIVGGESIVYGSDKKTEYLRRTLAEGEGIFQADAGSPLWHYVTPVRENPAVPPDYGHRSILGFDIDVLE
ncbi:MAG: 2OG-Fe dioxygenase family protein [bacterium]|nr:2OG-Fe dioxygenase family protein [bacterium]